MSPRRNDQPARDSWTVRSVGDLSVARLGFLCIMALETDPLGAWALEQTVLFPQTSKLLCDDENFEFSIAISGFSRQWKELAQVWWISIGTGSLQHLSVQIPSSLIQWEFGLHSLSNAKKFCPKHTLFHLVELFTTYLICEPRHNFIIISNFSTPNTKTSRVSLFREQNTISSLVKKKIYSWALVIQACITAVWDMEAGGSQVHGLLQLQYKVKALLVSSGRPFLKGKEQESCDYNSIIEQGWWGIFFLSHQSLKTSLWHNESRTK